MRAAESDLVAAVSARHYAEKPCADCKKPFTPSGPSAKFCAACRAKIFPAPTEGRQANKVAPKPAAKVTKAPVQKPPATPPAAKDTRQDGITLADAYRAVIADLRGKRDALDAAIEGLELVAEGGG